MFKKFEEVKKELDSKGIEYTVKERIDSRSIFDENGNQFFKEKANGFWIRRDHDKNGNLISYEDSKNISFANKSSEKKKIDIILEYQERSVANTETIKNILIFWNTISVIGIIILIIYMVG